MSFLLWDTIEGPWRRTPDQPFVPDGSQINAQWYAEQGLWSDLEAWQIWEEYLAPGAAPLGYDDPILQNISGRNRAVRNPSGTDEERIAATRRNLARQIDAQVPDDTARRLVEDPAFERSIESASGGASTRKSELEDTPDEELSDFDTSIIVTPISGEGYVEAKMTTFIDVVDPWAGAPNDVYAMRCIMRIITPGEEATGADARAHMFGPNDGPAGAVMPFQQDATDPTLWEAQTQLGRYWGNPNETASMRLLWGSGSLAVAETKILQGFGDRAYAVVRYGLSQAQNNPGRSRRSR